MPLKPETRTRRTIETLEHHKALIDALIAFVKAHPSITSKSSVRALYGKEGLSFSDYALIVPYWNKGNIVLRLVKSGEAWMYKAGSSDVETVVAEDVSRLSDDELERLLNGMYREVNPDGDDEDDKE
jgi:hypothetical protein